MTSNPKHLPVFQPDPFVERDWPVDQLLQVGELAKATGKTVRAIHLYESLELIRPQHRSKGRYRLFAPDAVLRVRWISKLQSLGLSLPDIQKLEQERKSGTAVFAAAQLRELYQAKLRETQKKLAELQSLEAELAQSIEYLSGCDDSCMPEVPVTSCLECDRHTEPSFAPPLVAGAQIH